MPRLAVLSIAALFIACAHPRIYSLNEVGSPPRLISRNAPDRQSVLGTGIVIAECVIRKDGSVGEIKIVRSPDTALAQATTDALRRWRFSPAQKDGKPVAARMMVTMNYSGS